MKKELKIYHVETQEDYDDLMINLENEGCMWVGRDKPTDMNFWYEFEEETVIYLGSWRKGEMTRGDLSEAKRKYSTIPIIKHKAKGVEQMEKVVVPQFVADWYEANKKFTMYGLLKCFEVGVKNEQLVDWIEAVGKGEAQRVIAKMHLFQNYEVEEKKYYWRKKKEHCLEFEYNPYSSYINLYAGEGILSFDDKEEDYPYITKFTESEIIDLLGEEDFKKLEKVEITEE